MRAMNLSAPPAVSDAGVGGRSHDKPESLPVVSATYPLSRAVQRAHAWGDVARGARAYRIWGTLPLMESVDLFRRTIIGPLVPMVNRGLSFVLAGLLLGRLFDTGDRYIPHVLVGLVTWFLIYSVVLNAGKTTFPRPLNHPGDGLAHFHSLL